FNPQGTRFVVPGPEPSSWVIHDAATLAPVATCRTTGLALDAPVISPDGRRMAFVAGASLARPPAWQVWLARLLRQPESFFSPGTPPRLIDLTTGAEAGRVPSGTTLLGFSPDSRSLWSYSQRMEGTTGQSVLEVEQWAVPTGQPPAWLIAGTALGVLLAVADWRHARRRRAATIGSGGNVLWPAW